MKVPLNTLLDDIAVAIGFTATTTLATVYGGSRLYVPTEASPDHVLAKMLGMPAFRALVEWRKGMGMPNRPIYVSPHPIAHGVRLVRNIEIVRMLAEPGATPQSVAAKTGLNARRVAQISLEFRSLENPPGKVPGKDRVVVPVIEGGAGRSKRSQERRSEVRAGLDLQRAIEASIRLGSVVAVKRSRVVKRSDQVGSAKRNNQARPAKRIVKGEVR